MSTTRRVPRARHFLVYLFLNLEIVAAAERARYVLVVGSANADTTLHVDRLPKRDETMLAPDHTTGRITPGGKGANQAVALARLLPSAIRTKFVCSLGDDANAAFLLDALQAEDVDTSSSPPPLAATRCGAGYVLLEPDGAATSIVVGGANIEWPAELSPELLELTTRASAVLLQREIPERVNEAVAAAAAAASVPVLLDAGGEAAPISDALLRCATVVAPNESELERLSGMPTQTDAEVAAAARALQARGARHVLVTLGERGAILFREECGDALRVPASVAPLVADATGAGDAFRAAFCVGLVEGLGMEQSLRLGAAAGAIAVQRPGGLPSMPRRAECDALLLRGGAAQTGEASAADSAPPLGSGGPLEFASRLNSMKARLDLHDGPMDTLGLVARQGRIHGLTMVDFNYPQHLEGLDVEAVRGALSAAGLRAGAICMRYPASMRAGALTSPDDALRRRAVELTREGCEWARLLGARELVVWSAFDGYDYNLQANHVVQWEHIVEAFREVCDAYPELRVSLEFKPTDENCRYFAVPSTGAALLLAEDVGRRNFGLTLDVGHCIMAGENPAQSAALAGARGRLFGVQLNDGHQRLGAEDGLIFSSVHPTMALELMYTLRKVNFDGHMYFDTFPRNEDPVAEAELNIRRVKLLWERAAKLAEAGIDEVLARQDALAALALLERVGSW